MPYPPFELNGLDTTGPCKSILTVVMTLFVGNHDAIDLTGEMWEDDFDSEDDDWYLEYSFLDDKPKQQTKHDERSKVPKVDQIVQDDISPVITAHLSPRPKPDAREFKSNFVNRSGSIKSILRRSPNDEYMTNSVPRRDFGQYIPPSKTPLNNNNRSIANNETSPKRLPNSCNPSPYNPSIYQSSHFGPSTNIRSFNHPNFNWRKNPGSPKSFAKVPSSKASLHGDFVTAADVAEARRSRTEKAAYKNDLWPFGLGNESQHYSSYRGLQKERLPAKQEATVETLLQESSPVGQGFYESDQNMDQLGQEYELSQEYGMVLRNNENQAQDLARVEDMAVTRSFHKPALEGLLNRRSTNLEPSKELRTLHDPAGNSKVCEKPVVSKR